MKVASFETWEDFTAWQWSYSAKAREYAERIGTPQAWLYADSEMQIFQMVFGERLAERSIH